MKLPRLIIEPKISFGQIVTVLVIALGAVVAVAKTTQRVDEVAFIANHALKTADDALPRETAKEVFSGYNSHLSNIDTNIVALRRILNAYVKEHK